MKRATLIAIAIMLLPGIAHASVIFQDDFNRPGGAGFFPVGNGWVEVEPAITDVEIQGSALNIEANSTATHILSGAFNDLIIKFDFQTFSFTTVLAFLSTDNVVFTQVGSANGSGSAEILTSLADGFTTAWLRLGIDTGPSSTGTVSVDNVEVSSPVPEPSTLGLIGLGLLGLGAMKRRRRKDAHMLAAV